MTKKNTIAYSFLIGDLLHYGHLKLLQQAKSMADYHICGVIGDDTAKEWQSPLITTYEEREYVINNLVCVDEVIYQDSLNPTENLKYIHNKFPEAKIILFRSHQNWGQMPGVEYIQQIGGEVIQPEYYPRLSRTQIAKSFFHTVADGDHNLNPFLSEDIHLGNISTFSEHLSTKANTLTSLKPILKKAKIEPIFVFTVSQWAKNKDLIFSEINNRFKGKTIIARSSSGNEDLIEYSSAGAYNSVLDIDSDDSEQVIQSVEHVINGYEQKGDFNEENQILIQQQSKDVSISGVIFTRNLETNAPYYLINYDDLTQRTDTVTSGLVNEKTEIFRETSIEDIPKKWKKLILATKEIEKLLSGMVLDIEFAINTLEDIIIFQVRPLAANSKFYTLSDDLIKERIFINQKRYIDIQQRESYLIPNIYLSDMAFWNPAELIGDRPNFLDCSMFNHLLMKTNWNQGLVPLGYTKVNEGLMTVLASKPYINVHNAFLSLLPDDLSQQIKIKLLNLYNQNLRNNPEWHDKIEFEIVHNCFDFTFDQKSSQLQKSGFTSEEINTLKESLLKLTNFVLNQFDSILKSDMEDIKRLEENRDVINQKIEGNSNWLNRLNIAHELLQNCKQLGTTQFSRIARLAFIGKRLLQSVRDIQAIRTEHYDMFMNSISTVASEMKDDFDKLQNSRISSTAFLNKFGHLRPGTYDITKLPYRKNPDYFKIDIPKEKERLEIDTAESIDLDKNIFEKLGEQITGVCNVNGIEADGAKILTFVKNSIQFREFIKFEYTKNISDALELIAETGKELGFNRDDLCYLDFSSLMIPVNDEYCNKEELINIWKNLINSRKQELKIDTLVSLPPLIFSEKDFTIVPYYINKPNFITQTTVLGEIVQPESSNTEELPDLTNKIVVLEKADPGYDWIFTYEIIGLITKYGGAASHMAIRCAEFKLPAAIGCGDILYSKIRRTNKILLDCKNKKIEIIG